MRCQFHPPFCNSCSQTFGHWVELMVYFVCNSCISSYGYYSKITSVMGQTSYDWISSYGYYSKVTSVMDQTFEVPYILTQFATLSQFKHNKGFVRMNSCCILSCLCTTIKRIVSLKSLVKVFTVGQSHNNSMVN